MTKGEGRLPRGDYCLSPKVGQKLAGWRVRERVDQEGKQHVQRLRERVEGVLTHERVQPEQSGVMGR